MKIGIINGPNLNLLGIREKSIYGDQDFDSYFESLQDRFSNVELHYFQSNMEGELVEKIQQWGFVFDGLILNAGAYTHTSIAISDAIAAVEAPCMEVHISHIYAREEFRHKSIISQECKGMISGLGLKGYDLALQFYLES